MVSAVCKRLSIN
jgi:hypothetical protein